MPEFLTYPIRGKKFSYSIEILAHLYSGQTPFQQIDVYETACFGKILTLDGHVQLSDLDEHAYHESLVHIPMLSIPNPKRALVVGGGDGGALRELCKWKSLETIEMVEIDQAVIESCRKWLPNISEGAFEDPRVKVQVGDAFEFVAKAETPYDFIVMDITDVYEEEDEALSENLVTAKFLTDVRQALTPTGLAVSQADNQVFCPYSMEALLKSLQAVFPNTGQYQAIVPSFGGFSGYCWAGKSTTISSNWPGNQGLPLRYLNEATYAFALSPLAL